jgi:hypothetical protein
VIFPPPLSPNNQPEDIDAAGILAKSTEVTLVFGILYLMKTEKKRFEKRIAIARTYHDDDDSTGIDEGYFASTNTNTKESI